MAIIASTGKRRNFRESLWAIVNQCWFGVDSTGIDLPPLALNAAFITGVNAAGTGVVNLIGPNAADGATIPVALTVTGAFTPTGGAVQTSATTWKHQYAGGITPIATTSGTDTAGINGTVFISEIFVPANMTLTGLSFLIGTVGGTDKAIAMLFSSAGALLANSALAGVTVSTAATFQRLPFTATYAAIGPGKYYVGVQYNGATAKIRTQPAGDHDAVSISQTFGTPVAITAPSTFTASTGPISMLY